MAQYWRIKSCHKDRLLFFRLGDFFEMFGEDAEKAAPILNIALTSRNKKSKKQIKMCGLPHHSISAPIAKLLGAGFSVALCDQIEPAETARGAVVKRAVTRIFSPGIVYDPDAIDQSQPNYIAAFDKKFVSFLDASTGQAFYYKVNSTAETSHLLALFSPAELIITPSQKQNPPPFARKLRLTAFDKENLSELAPGSGGHSRFSHPIMEKYGSWPESAKKLIRYALFMQGESVLSLLSSFKLRSLSREMDCSSQLFDRLEVFKNYEGSASGALFAAINRTKTPGGARQLKRRMQSPLIDQKEIERRWDQIDWWISRQKIIEPARKILSALGDVERKLGKLALSACSGRDLLTAADALSRGLQLQELTGDDPFPAERQKAQQARDKIRAIIKPSAPAGFKEGSLINRGVNPQRDEWENLAANGQKAILEIERAERRKTKIPSLKIRYNNIFGYYIEITKNHTAKAPASYRRKQTLVHAERYTMDELDSLEAKILSAQARQIELERSIFQELKKEILSQLPDLLRLAYFWSETDVFSSLAFLAIEKKYVRPRFGRQLRLVGSRHPVLEQKALQEFVPNTITLNPGETLLLTGPNMSGKSVLMRQAALIALLAQSGCFVPAAEATLPLFHKMFARIGASDFLSKGMSTFMVEMREMAEILEKANSKSLIILDEIGRGTATFDGMSLAQAILEFLILEKQPFLLSATHYHELTHLAEKYPSVRNGSMAVRESIKEAIGETLSKPAGERASQIHFLYTLTEQPANKSYGIHVAQLAGLPKAVLERADQLLEARESSSKKTVSGKGAANQRPNQNLSEKPDRVLAESPAAKREPNQNLTEKPDRILAEDPEAKREPEQNLTEKPDRVLAEGPAAKRELEQNLSEKPDRILAESPAAKREPEQNLTEKPDRMAAKDPAAARDQKPRQERSEKSDRAGQIDLFSQDFSQDPSQKCAPPNVFSPNTPH